MFYEVLRGQQAFGGLFLGRGNLLVSKGQQGVWVQDAGYGVQDMGCAVGSRGGGDSEPCLVQPPPASRLPGKGLWCRVWGWVPGVSGEK